MCIFTKSIIPVFATATALVVCVSTKHSPKYAARVPLYVAFARDAGARAATSSSSNQSTPSFVSNGPFVNSSNGFGGFGVMPNGSSAGGFGPMSSGSSVMLTSRPAAQAFLVQAAHQMPRRRFEDSRTWLFLGIALAMVQALKLDEEGLRAVRSMSPSSSSPIEDDGTEEVYFEHEDGHRTPLRTRDLRARWKADAARTWLTAFALDAGVAAQLGKPAVLARDAALARRAEEWCRAWGHSSVSANLPADLGIAAQVDVARVVRGWRVEVGNLESQEGEGEGDDAVKLEDRASDAEKLKSAKERNAARVKKVLECVWRCNEALCESRNVWAARFESDGLVHGKILKCNAVTLTFLTWINLQTTCMPTACTPPRCRMALADSWSCSLACSAP